MDKVNNIFVKGIVVELRGYLFIYCIGFLDI